MFKHRCRKLALWVEREFFQTFLKEKPTFFLGIPDTLTSVLIYVKSSLKMYIYKLHLRLHTSFRAPYFISLAHQGTKSTSGFLTTSIVKRFHVNKSRIVWLSHEHRAQEFQPVDVSERIVLTCTLISFSSENKRFDGLVEVEKRHRDSSRDSYEQQNIQSLQHIQK